MAGNNVDRFHPSFMSTCPQGSSSKGWEAVFHLAHGPEQSCDMAPEDPSYNRIVVVVDGLGISSEDRYATHGLAHL